MCHVLWTGAQKYGSDNWRGITVEENLNHLLAHVYGYLSGDRSEPHLANIMCRAMFAQAKDLRPTYVGAMQPLAEDVKEALQSLRDVVRADLGLPGDDEVPRTDD